MIPATDLRIGNWVLWNGPDHVEKAIIASISNEEVGFKCGDYGLITELDPIILTDDILTAFNFLKHRVTKEDNQVWRRTWTEGAFDLEKIRNYYFGGSCYSVQVNQVHQLQNLYYFITKEELLLRYKL